MTVQSRVVQLFLQAAPDMDYVPLKNGLRLQVMQSLEELPRARKHQFAAFIAGESLLIVWDDEPSKLIDRARAIEEEIIQLIWDGSSDSDEDIKKEDTTITVAEVIDQENGIPMPTNLRRVRLASSVMCALTTILLFAMIGAGLGQTAVDTFLDQNYVRIAVVLFVPIQLFFALVSTI